MIKKIAKWILKMVDVDVKLDQDILNIKVYLGGVLLVEWTIDLIKNNAIVGVAHGTWKKA